MGRMKDLWIDIENKNWAAGDTMTQAEWYAWQHGLGPNHGRPLELYEWLPKYRKHVQGELQ